MSRAVCAWCLPPGAGLKVQPQYVSATELWYLIKSSPGAELASTSGGPAVAAALRSPTWAPGGATVVYEKVDFAPRAQNTPLFSWTPDVAYRYSDVFPTIAPNDGTLVVTEKAASDGAISITDADCGHEQRLFAASNGAAFAPSRSPHGLWIAFGVWGYLQRRKTKPETLMLMRRDGSDVRELTGGSLRRLATPDHADPTAAQPRVRVLSVTP